jgi:protein-tyrosine-phosphatase
MKEVGYDLTTHRSKSLDEIPSEDFDYAITMGCGDACPNVRARHREDWQIPDPKDLPPAEFDKVRDLIESRVEELLSRIE